MVRGTPDGDTDGVTVVVDYGSLVSPAALRGSPRPSARAARRRPRPGAPTGPTTSAGARRDARGDLASRPMGLCDDVRQHCAAVAARRPHVTIDEDALGAYDLDGPRAEPDALDPERHYLEGTPERSPPTC